MKRNVLANTANAVLLSLAMRNPLPAAAPGNPLVGVWKLDASPNGLTGIYIFTDTFYSMVAATADRPDIAGDLLTIHPAVAKTPVVMAPGAYEVYRFHIDGDTLSLTHIRNSRGPVEPGAAWKFTRAKN